MKNRLFRALWLPALMAAAGLSLLLTRISFFQGHNPSHNQAVIAYYYIYDPVTGYATAKVTHYQDGCHITENMEPIPAPAIVSIFDRKGSYVGKWSFEEDNSRTWYSAGGDSLLAFTSPLVESLLSARNKRRSPEKFFLL